MAQQRIYYTTQPYSSYNTSPYFIDSNTRNKQYNVDSNFQPIFTNLVSAGKNGYSYPIKKDQERNNRNRTQRRKTSSSPSSNATTDNKESQRQKDNSSCHSRCTKWLPEDCCCWCFCVRDNHNAHDTSDHDCCSCCGCDSCCECDCDCCDWDVVDCCD
ncbi:unnamed protein product [Adineta ricciae]|nr:unnamed protein product [Adineta ricciae]